MKITYVTHIVSILTNIKVGEKMIEHQIRQLLDEISVHKRKQYFEQLRKIGLHIGQDQLLCQLSKEDGMTQIQLSECLQCEPPTVANALKSLENRGFVERKRDEVDGRTKRVYLTDEGKKLISPVRQVWLAEQEKLLKGLEASELQQLKTLLEKMVCNLSTASMTKQ